MGAGTAISFWTLVSGIFMIVFGFIISLTIIGLIIGIPMIIAGANIIAGGAVTGATIGAYKGYRRLKEDNYKDKVARQENENHELKSEVERLKLELEKEKLKKKIKHSR